LCYEAGEFSEAFNIISEFLQRGKEYGAEDPINIESHILLGYILTEQGEYDAAEDCLWLALSNALVAFGPQQSETIRMHSTYMAVLDKQKARNGTIRGSTQSPKISSDTSAEPLQPFSRRRAKGLGCKSALDYGSERVFRKRAYSC
jgi:hypothetical protein